MTETQYSRAVEAFSSTVYRIAYHYFGNQSDAEDVMQECFLKLYRQDRGIASDEELKRWLIRITINECHSLFRRMRRRKTVSLADSDWDALPDTAQIEAWTQRRETLEAVLALPPKYRVAVYLFYYEGYSAREIGRMTGASEGAVQTRLMRARKKLKERLKDEWEESR